jgi:hypothetical protein
MRQIRDAALNGESVALADKPPVLRQPAGRLVPGKAPQYFRGALVKPK